MQEETFETTLTSKGQVIIGIKARKKLGLRPKQKLIGQVKGGEIVLKPVDTPLELGGTLKIARGRPTAEIMKELKKGWE
jgi:bifunctional DNA-binding transcriptional regulator/antitoxin component of YhaV-PrlF toxin-antitoxin module